ncbi:hypothetical protein LCGC14_2202150 [marine sediment metagenome]|uniref:Uncharacterized protein n=1 Tax=marine sediment metagenome TaxID=412755 RepID=A0A0F9DGF4_9ZZZZ
MKRKKVFGLLIMVALFALLAVWSPGLALTTLPLFGAVTIAEVSRTNDKAVFDITATADVDTTATIVHGLGQVPGGVVITATQQAIAELSLWAAETIDATNVVMTKSVAVGSGDAAAQVRVEVSRT